MMPRLMLQEALVVLDSSELEALQDHLRPQAYPRRTDTLRAFQALLRIPAGHALAAVPRCRLEATGEQCPAVEDMLR